MRLIYAEDVKKRADCYLPSVRSVVANILSHTKTVKDAVEVVRCKDCKHLFEDNKCPLRTWWTHTEDDYCSFGERSEDGRIDFKTGGD